MRMNKTEACRYLAQAVEEAIVDAEVPLHYLVGQEGVNGKDGLHMNKLIAALKALGYEDAAARCENVRR